MVLPWERFRLRCSADWLVIFQLIGLVDSGRGLGLVISYSPLSDFAMNSPTCWHREWLRV